MSSELERRWDDAMEEAWTGFRARLADRLAEIDDGESLVVQLPDEDLLGASPYCQVLVDQGWLRVEAVSNAFLDAQYELTGEQEGALVDLGFGAPAKEQSPNFWVDLQQREADRAAWMMSQALREVYGVVHPIYLDADGLEAGASGLESLAPTSPGRSEPGNARLASLASQPPADDIRFPESSDELLAAMQRVIRDMLGREAILDEDGDIPVMTEKTLIYLTVSKQAPRMLMHATLVTDVMDEQRALVEVNLLNTTEFGLTFVLSDGRISVRRELPMTAVVPGDVRMEVERLRADADRWVTELLIRVGGRSVAEDGPVHEPHDRQRTPMSDEPGDERFDQALRVLRELESEERGSVDPATMVRIFHGDRDLLLELGGWSTARSNRWGERRRKAEAEGKASFAKLCRAQQRYHRELRDRARQALRAVVQTPVTKPERQSQLSLFSEDEASA